MKDDETILGDASQGVGPTLIVAELDLEDAWGEFLNDGTHLAPNQIGLRQVLAHRHDVKELNGMILPYAG